jgi:hypothetical protein
MNPFLRTKLGWFRMLPTTYSNQQMITPQLLWIFKINWQVVIDYKEALTN